MRRTLLVGIALTLAGCAGNEPAGPAPSDISGSYQLTMFDASELPLTVLDFGAYQVELVSGSLSLNGDGNYSLEFDYRILDSGNVRTGVSRDTGRWNDLDGTLTLASTTADISITGSITGDTIKLESSGRQLLLRKMASRASDSEST